MGVGDQKLSSIRMLWAAFIVHSKLSKFHLRKQARTGAAGKDNSVRKEYQQQESRHCSGYTITYWDGTSRESLCWVRYWVRKLKSGTGPGWVYTIPNGKVTQYYQVTSN